MNELDLDSLETPQKTGEFTLDDETKNIVGIVFTDNNMNQDAYSCMKCSMKDDEDHKFSEEFICVAYSDKSLSHIRTSLR